MRLINVDEVKNSLLIELLGGVDGGTDASYLKTYEVIDRIENIVNEWVDNQPIVEAIPIEWIWKWDIDNYPFTALLMSEIIPKMLEDWEKENQSLE